MLTTFIYIIMKYWRNMA